MSGITTVIQDFIKNDPSFMENFLNKGRMKEILEKIPIFDLSEKHCKKNEKGELEFPTCSVCCSNFNLGDKTMLLPCGHLFHPDCIRPWFNEHNSCPVCRFELPTDDPNFESSRNLHRNQPHAQHS